MAKKSAKGDDLLLTIDSDDEQNVYEKVNSDSESETEAPVPKKAKKSKKGKKAAQPEPEAEDKEAADLNPDFQFIVEGGMASSRFDGWDFAGDEKTGRKDVDLDGILRRKGGLVNQMTGEEEAPQDEEEEEDEEEDEEEEEEEDDEAEEDDDDEAEEANGEDEDDLAMDGFGMGVQAEAEEAEEDEEAEAEEEQASEDEAPVEADMDEEHGDDEEKEDVEDSAEAIKEFYDTEEPATKQKHTSFNSLQLSRPVLKGLAQLGYTKPSPIQSAAIPIGLLGKDIVAGAQTGSGKTAAFMIPIIERLVFKPAKGASTRVIILTPTRELSIQVFDVAKKIGQFVRNLNFGLAVGGLNLRQQEQQLKSRPDIVIATPGRLIDHIRNSPSFSIDQLEVLVIDEADRMLEEGFQAELEEILSLVPKHKRQTMLFSATMNTKIQDLIKLSLVKPVRIMIDPPKAAATRLVQEFVRIRKREAMKPALLYNIVSTLQSVRTVVFVARKETAHRLRVVLGLLGLKVAELHGSLSQEQRLQSVNDFKSLTVPVLLCTDLAARGLDIPKIEVVINYDMPKSHEIYLHRVGRTARAGREGKSVSFVGESTSDRNIVKDAIKSLAASQGASVASKALSRSVDWKAIEEINKVVESKKETVEEVLVEEKQEKEILQAEMQLTKAENLMKHEKEIASRPKRTWFQSGDGDVKQKQKKLNSRKRKQQEELKEGRVYKKTKGDRTEDANRNPRMKRGKKEAKGKGKRK
ncbi:ATP-dependent RNA helicase Drs1p [Diutina catenulata]